MPVIVPELHLIQVQGELVRGDPVVLEQLPLGIAPKAFEPVDMDLPPTEPLAVIDGEPPIAAERERLVAAIFIGVDQRPPLDHLDRLLQERLGRDVRHDGDRDPSAPLQNAKDGHFAGGASAPLPLAPAAEVRLVGLDLAPQQLGVLLGHERPADRREHPQRRGVADAGLDRGLPSGHLQLEQLDQPQPGRQGDARLAHPGAGEEPEGIATPPTPRPAAAQPVEFLAPTGVTKQPPVFVTLPPQHPQGRGLAPDQCFKGLDAHGTGLILVPDALQSPLFTKSAVKHFTQNGDEL